MCMCVCVCVLAFIGLRESCPTEIKRLVLDGGQQGGEGIDYGNEKERKEREEGGREEEFSCSSEQRASVTDDHVRCCSCE